MLLPLPLSLLVLLQVVVPLPQAPGPAPVLSSGTRCFPASLGRHAAPRLKKEALPTTAEAPAEALPPLGFDVVGLPSSCHISTMWCRRELTDDRLSALKKSALSQCVCWRRLGE